MPTLSSTGPVLVTGGAGAIGTVLVRELLRSGRTVRVVDNLSSGRRERLPTGIAADRLSLTVADVRNPESYADAMRGVEEVWHLAANPDIRKGTADPTIDFELGTVATFRLLEAARRAGAKRFLFSSSSVVYGLPTVFPTPEGYGPLLPQSQYGAAKLAAEGLLSAYCHSYGLRGWIFRFANIVGPGMTHGIVYDFLQKLRQDGSRLEVLGDGSQAKSYLWVDDCVSGMLQALAGATDPVSVFNLGTDDQAPVREIARRVVAALGRKARIDYTGGPRGWTGDVPQQLLATDRLRRLGWKPSGGSLDAIDRAIAVTRAELGL